VLGIVRALRSAEWGAMMEVMELIALVASAALLVYLTVALLKPEWFS
jgi:K+-transporting ATPase KdpF subunit